MEEEEKGCYDILYECPACGKKVNMAVETWYLWDVPACEDCDIDMVEISRIMEF
ncbi:hypothetical protein KAR91_16880 [Candidatus Pacearchaeota archaeon]|nr:hypothetical protein [Candidatus Pacearchaeota archaeon]